MNYTIDYFIAKFSAIPDRLWDNGQLGMEHDPKCALGHCGVIEGERGYISTTESDALGTFLKPVLEKIRDRPIHIIDAVWEINDGSFQINPTLGKTPKERILKALELAKAYFPSTEKQVVSQPVRELVTK